MNAGTVERAVRVVAGLAVVGLVFTGAIGVWGWIGIVPLLTGAIGFCPVTQSDWSEYMPYIEIRKGEYL